MRQPITQFLWENFEFRVGAIDGSQICSLRPSDHIFYVLVCFCVGVNSQTKLTKLNSWKISQLARCEF